MHDKGKPTNEIPWPTVTQRTISDDNAEGPRIRVRSISPQPIYYDFMRRYEGDVFTLVPKWVTVVDKNTTKPIKENGVIKRVVRTAEEQFSSETMERVEDEEQETVTTAQEALTKQQDEITESRRSQGRPRISG
jgi:hypothetical protein